MREQGTNDFGGIDFIWTDDTDDEKLDDERDC